MNQENRRSFVKKSLATSVSISFTGLIRAHGESGGGTTTWSPEENTNETTDSGGTTTWNPDEYTFDSGDSTTWNPDESTFDSGDSTTWNPDESTEVLTTERTKYRLESSPTGTRPPPDPNIPESIEKWDPYREQWINVNLQTPSSNLYAAKAKFWVNPPEGKGGSINIEYCAEFFPNGVATGAAPVQTTEKMEFSGDLPDPYFPAMTASLTPESNIPSVPTKTATEPNPISGLLSAAKPDMLAQTVFDVVKAKKPSGAVTYSVFTQFTLDLNSTPDFSTLPSKANVQFNMTAISYYAINWYDSNHLQIGSTYREEFNGIGQIVTMEICVAPEPAL